MADELNIYSLSRSWFDFSFENPDKIRPSHTALYFFAIEHCNRLGWKQKFGFPTTMAMEAIGIKSYNTYKETLSDLVDWGFIKMVEKSKNQYSANIIALSKNDKAHNKALDKALTKHSTKQSESTVQSIDSIDIQLYNNTNIPYTNIQASPFDLVFNDFVLMRKKIKKAPTEKAIELIIQKLESLAPGNEYLKIKILEQSIMNSYQGVFPLHENNRNNSVEIKKGKIQAIIDVNKEIINPYR